MIVQIKKIVDLDKGLVEIEDPFCKKIKKHKYASFKTKKKQKKS